MIAPLTLFLPDEAATTRLGAALALHLGPGDCLLLEGPIGAGKSHLARALIQSRLGRAEEVPSPSFTLVQTYEADGVEIWHADLYRLSHPDEALELGLSEAFEHAITLVEWPDRLGSAVPVNALRLTLALEGEGRRATITAPHRPELIAALERDFVPDRAESKAQFLRRTGWGDASRVKLAGDASDRSYERLRRGGQTAVLMDAPPGKGDDPADFTRIARHLRQIGLSAPEVLAEDLTTGFLLLEDLGDGLLSRRLAEDPALELPLYALAIDVLQHLQSHPAPPDLQDLSAKDWAEAAMLALDWYRFALTGDKTDHGPLRAALTAAMKTHADGPRVLILRDFHADNLMDLPDRPGLARLGLLDFQLAQLGQPGYDLVSLLQDARRDVPLVLEQAMITRFAGHADFRQSYAVLGVQRALRILGIFARLCLVGGKQGYLPLIPRVWIHLQRNLQAPGLEEVAALCRALLPEPSPENLARIGAQCARFR